MENNLPATGGKPDPLRSLLAQTSVKKRFEDVLGKKAPGFMSSIVSAVTMSKKLKEADPMSIVSSAAVAAALDLPINPSLGFAYIVPYAGKAQFQMGYKGFIQLAMRTGQYKTLNATVVYEGELVRTNRFTGDMEFEESGKTSDTIIGYVAYFRLINGFEKWLYMTEEAVTAHGKKYAQSYTDPKGKWQTDPEAMKLKTVIKMLLSHYGILSIEMQTALQADQAVVRKDGTYSYPDNGDIIDAEDDSNLLSNGTDTPPDFAASIPEGTDTAALDDFISRTAKAQKCTPDEVKAAAAKDGTGFWKAFGAWQIQERKRAEIKAAKEADQAMAAAECPNSPGTIYAASYCDKCASRVGCPAWEVSNG